MKKVCFLFFFLGEEKITTKTETTKSHNSLTQFCQKKILLPKYDYVLYQVNCRISPFILIDSVMLFTEFLVPLQYKDWA